MIGRVDLMRWGIMTAFDHCILLWFRVVGSIFAGEGCLALRVGCFRSES